MTKNLKDVEIELKDIANKTGAFFDKISHISEKANGKSSSILFGMLGGVLGSVLSIIIAPYIAVSTLVLSIPLTIIGIVGGVLLFRGPDGIAVERMISKNSMAANEVLRRINALPKNAPKPVRDGLWENYLALNGAYLHNSQMALSVPKEKTEDLKLNNSLQTL